MENCSICGEKIASESPIYYFPKLYPTHVLAKFAGAVHVSCIRELSKTMGISTKLCEAYVQIFGKNSTTPIVAVDGNLLVKDSIETSGCYDVYDFDDFVTFYVPRQLVSSLRGLQEGGEISLGAQKLQTLYRRIGGKLELEIKRPRFVVDLPSTNLERLVACLDAAERAVSQRV